MLVALASVDDLSAERVVVDPNAMDSTGSVTIDFFVPSLDGSKVAVSLSRGGTESGDVHIFDVATGRHYLGRRAITGGITAPQCRYHRIVGLTVQALLLPRRSGVTRLRANLPRPDRRGPR